MKPARGEAGVPEGEPMGVSITTTNYDCKTKIDKQSNTI